MGDENCAVLLEYAARHAVGRRTDAVNVRFSFLQRLAQHVVKLSGRLAIVASELSGHCAESFLYGSRHWLLWISGARAGARQKHKAKAKSNASVTQRLAHSYQAFTTSSRKLLTRLGDPRIIVVHVRRGQQEDLVGAVRLHWSDYGPFRLFSSGILFADQMNYRRTNKRNRQHLPETWLAVAARPAASGNS